MGDRRLRNDLQFARCTKIIGSLWAKLNVGCRFPPRTQKTAFQDRVGEANGLRCGSLLTRFRQFWKAQLVGHGQLLEVWHHHSVHNLLNAVFVEG